MKLSELLMCQGVKRWHIVEMSRTQTVAEHSFNVAMIAGEFASKMGFCEEALRAVLGKSLLHDADEVHLGDVPAIAKAEPMLKASQIDRAVQIADKLEAHWFAKHYAIGPRAEFVIKDTADRYRGLINASKPNERAMWDLVLLEMKT